MDQCEAYDKGSRVRCGNPIAADHIAVHYPEDSSGNPIGYGHDHNVCGTHYSAFRRKVKWLRFVPITCNDNKEK